MVYSIVKYQELYSVYISSIHVFSLHFHVQSLLVVYFSWVFHQKPVCGYREQEKML